MQIFQLSPFVENQFNSYPELRNMLGEVPDLQSDWQDFRFKSPHSDIFSVLRKYRRSRLALIAAQDLQHNDLLKTLHNTSLLARILIRHAYDYALSEHERKYGRVIYNDHPQSFIIFALGKLGGNELNYSSDVDLVFCYSGAGQSDGNKCLDAQSYFQRLGQRIIQILETVTADGIVYRVDMRLRPFGSASPLVCSVSNLIKYLENEGRDWERYAWLRASCIAGDMQLGKDTLTNIQPFIYRKYLDYNVFESLRQIKEQISRKQQGDEDNIKLGIGGIREIEFVVQTLQLTFAGRNIKLRGNDLWQQFHNLKDFNHLTVKELQQLTEAWIFLRRLENLCQIINDSNTHHLPDNTDELAECMQFRNSQELLSALDIHRKQVHSIFTQLFLSNQQKQNNQYPHPDIQKIKDEVAEKKYPKSSKHKIYAVWDATAPLLNQYENKQQIIARLQQLINSISRRISYLSMLIESPLILEKLISLISQSSYISSAVTKMPALLENLFETYDKQDIDVITQWNHFSDKHNISNEESFLDVLCQFKQTIQFRIVNAYLQERITAAESSELLSQLAEHILTLVIAKSLEHVQSSVKTDIKAEDLIAVAYGSLATKSMHLNSDFDIVFISEKDLSGENYKFMIRWIKRIINLLSLPTYYGSLYDIDTQLRPNGKSGTAIVTKSAFETYQKNDAWIWEHAALIKTRAVCATPSQKKWYEKLRHDIICRKRDSQQVEIALNEMAEKLSASGKIKHQQEFEFLGNILKKSYSDETLSSMKHVISNNNYQKFIDSIH